jgi:hypothetical protein
MGISEALLTIQALRDRGIPDKTLATGNTIVVKPSCEDPFSQVNIAELAEEAGFPDGVHSVMHGGRQPERGRGRRPGVGAGRRSLL